MESIGKVKNEFKRIDNQIVTKWKLPKNSFEFKRIDNQTVTKKGIEIFYKKRVFLKNEFILL